MGYNRGMGIELCKYMGGTCNLCGSGDVCTRKPSVDMSVVRRFKEGPHTVMRYPTCGDYEGYWRRVWRERVTLIPGDNGSWDGLTSAGTVLRIYPKMQLYPSRWFEGGCGPVTTTVLVKNPTNNYGHLNTYFGIPNGMAMYENLPFAVNMDIVPKITRPVQQSYRRELLNLFLAFTNTYDR
jgi:hypothetical protein